MDVMLKFCAFAVLATICIMVVKEKQPSLALLLTIAATCALGTMAITYAADIMGKIQGFMAALDIDSALFTPVLKVLAVSLLCRITVELCRGSGERTLAVCIEIAGTICAIVCAIPLFERAIGYLGGML